MKTDELREAYLSFFESKGCTRRASDVLVPTWDPSVLFTPAGMNQFKDHFLGRCKLDFTRATTCQKCLRTGDIDNVGRTAYHHTFFEMLGNFSFGDYFKRDAIHWAWEFLTSKKWLGLDPARLTVTVYLDDDEAAGIWAKDIGLTNDRITRMGEDDNFWPAGAPTNGPDGVCGPCSEIFYHPPTGGEVEIWNLVFTQFNRVGEPPDNLRPLPSKNIDTGMGLERCASTLQGVDTNFHIDILKPIVDAAAEVVSRKYDPKSDDGRRIRRITDHVRACTFAVHENVYPGPNKEKYVIRRLLRRAVLDGHQMGLREPFLYQLVPTVVEMMKKAYPDLTETSERVAKVIRQEESAFLGTIDAGLNKIETIFNDMRRDHRAVVRGDDIFFMFDTNGFPPELFEQIAAEHNFTFDWPGFRKLTERGADGPTGPLFKHDPLEAIKRAVGPTEFLGYETTEAKAEVVAIVAQHQLCDSLEEVGQDQPVQIVLDCSPFYGESGGQVGDVGEIVGSNCRFEVIDTQRDGQLIVHLGHLRSGKLTIRDQVQATVNTERRQGIRRAHSATHVLHYALQKHLGKHAQQQGSKVDEDWLRFDFTNLEAVDKETLATIESEVADRVAAGSAVQWQTLPLAEARKQGAMMLFGEKYPDPVRMVSMGDFSRELCGGIHLDNTRQIEDFEILSEESVSAGVRRIIALTGAKARQHAEQVQQALAQTAELLKVSPTDVPTQVEALSRQVRQLKKQASSGAKATETMPQPTAGSAKPLSATSARQTLEQAARQLNTGLLEVPDRVRHMLGEIERLQQELSSSSQAQAVSADSLLAQAVEFGGAKVVAAEVSGANPNQMRQWIDQLRKQHSPIAVLLIGGSGDKLMVVAGVSQPLVERGASAGNWVQQVAPVLGGGGGGRPDMAQAGGKDASQIPQALQKAKEVAAHMLM